MKVEDQQLKTFLMESNLVSKENMETALSEARESGENLEDVVLKKKLVSEDNLNKLKAYVLGIPYVDLKKSEIDPEILKIIPEPVARQYNAVAFDKQGNQLKVAMLDPNDLQFLDFISKKTGLEIVPCLSDSEGIKKSLKLFQKSLKAEFGDLVQGAEVAGDGTEGDQKLVIKAEKDGGDVGIDLEKAAEDLPVVKIVDTLLKHAILQGASDIHVEPEENDLVVRYRLDGVLHDAMTLPRITLPGIVARIKVLSNLKIDEHRLPQDGRFKVEASDYKVAFRVSIIPVFDGEKIVMRLLDESSDRTLNLEQMGFRERDLGVVNRGIQKPNGMILVVGPTGSGKTTTLYTVLGMLNTPGVNISTLEDPIEYRMARVNQSQINAKISFTFAAGLRSLLRQDPDIIMVGEIRDRETAELAVHAALTGHLVLSTLHTSSAAGTLPRLTDMGVESFMLSSTANLIISQRLVRKVCQECKEEFSINEETYKSYSQNFNTEKISKILVNEKIVTGKFKNDKELWMSIKFVKGKGCVKCRNEGYKGRAGIFEVLEITDSIAKLINTNATSDVIENQSVAEGMNTMMEDGLVKAVNGITTIEEVMRVTKE